MNLEQANALTRRYLETGFEVQFQQALEWLQKAVENNELPPSPLFSLSSKEDSRLVWPLVLHVPRHCLVQSSTLVLDRVPSERDIQLVLQYLPSHVYRLSFTMGDQPSIIQLATLEPLLRLPQVTDIEFPPKACHLLAPGNMAPLDQITGYSGPPLHLDGLARLFPNLAHLPPLSKSDDYRRLLRKMRNIKYLDLFPALLKAVDLRYAENLRILILSGLSHKDECTIAEALPCMRSLANLSFVWHRADGLEVARALAESSHVKFFRLHFAEHNQAPQRLWSLLSRASSVAFLVLERVRVRYSVLADFIQYKPGTSLQCLVVNSCKIVNHRGDEDEAKQRSFCTKANHGIVPHPQLVFTELKLQDQVSWYMHCAARVATHRAWSRISFLLSFLRANRESPIKLSGLPLAKRMLEPNLHLLPNFLINIPCR